MIPISNKPAEALSQWPRWAFSFPDQTALISIVKDGQLGERQDCYDGEGEAPAEPFLGSPGASPSRRPLALMHVTWGQLVQAVDVLCHRLIDLGMQPGDRIIHRLGNSVDGVLVALASAALGTIEVPLEATVDPIRFQAVIDQVDGKELVAEDCLDLFRKKAAAGSTADDCAQSLLDRQSRHSPESASLILMTSGTSGLSKAVTLSRRNLSANAAAKLAAVPQAVDDVRLTLLPICHAYARTCDLGTWLLSGSKLAIGSGWDGWQRLASSVRPTLVNTVPSIAMRLLQLPSTSSEMSRLRLVGCGGAALGAEAFERFRSRGITVIQGYGMTETSPVICSATPENARAGFVGTPVAGWQTRIDAEGRLSVKGECAMIGYWGDPDATARRCVDGWVDTGDLVEVDPVDGQFRILGRADDRITLSNGRKLYPLIIEQRVLMVPQVRHAILVAADRHTELWIDVQGDQDRLPGRPEAFGGDESWANRIAPQLLDLPSWQLPRQVFVMPKSLADLPGLLTTKGTPVRPRVIDMIQRWRKEQAIDALSIDVAEQ